MQSSGQKTSSGHTTEQMVLEGLEGTVEGEVNPNRMGELEAAEAENDRELSNDSNHLQAVSESESEDDEEFMEQRNSYVYSVIPEEKSELSKSQLGLSISQNVSRTPI